jgi:hypothetical protein
VAGADLDIEASARVSTFRCAALARLYLTGRLGRPPATRLAREQCGDRWLLSMRPWPSKPGSRSARYAQQALRELRQAIGRDPDAASTEVAALLAVASYLAGQPTTGRALDAAAASTSARLMPR